MGLKLEPERRVPSHRNDWGICRAHLPATEERATQSPVVWMDDTGWRVDARPQNLRVLLSEQVTVIRN